jgi:hydroxymethylglutaryl-CoA reductase (NADPH)
MNPAQIPRSPDDDYTQQAAAKRREFIEQQSGVGLHHVGQYSLDPGTLPGNIENFTGIVQMPLGFAGPLRVNGEHAQGDFYVPMATTEGTLVASYSRGMKLTREAGGITTTVVDDAMQRSPVYVFDDARQARDFSDWLLTRFADIKSAAESTTSVGQLRNIEQYPASKMI